MLAREHLAAGARSSDRDWGLGPGWDQLEARVKRSSRAEVREHFHQERAHGGEVVLRQAHRDRILSRTRVESARSGGFIRRTAWRPHVIGYVGEISESELNLGEFIKYDQAR